jgi:hypothetical protein
MDALCETTTFIDTLISFGNLFCCINSAGNFLFYMLRGKKFRDAFNQTYFFWLPGFHPRRSNSPMHGGVSMNTLDPMSKYTVCNFLKVKSEANGRNMSMSVADINTINLVHLTAGNTPKLLTHL